MASNREDSIELDRSLVVQSGIFDRESYLQQAGRDAEPDPVGHYLREGWAAGFEPNPSFPGALLQPYFASIGFSGPPLITWLMQKAAGWPMPTGWNELNWQATKVRASGLFDEAFYASRLAPGSATGLDLAFHYVIAGERLGIAPSTRFDPEFYLNAYPDIARAGLICLLHYHNYGQVEGRLGMAEPLRRQGQLAYDPQKQNILLVCHETSRTGAPVLGWNLARELAKIYNVYTILMGDGELTSDFERTSTEMYGPFSSVGQRHPAYLERGLRPLLSARKFRYAIVNSVESRYVLEACAHKYIATLLLMHEFASSVHPAGSLFAAFDWASEIVFPARVVAESAEDKYEVLSGRVTQVMPQGAPLLPERKLPPKAKSNATLEKLTRKRETEGTFIVLGAGGVQVRKGVEFFLAAAAAVARRRQSHNIHFLWVGHGYHPDEDLFYSAYLYEQLKRSGLNEIVTFMDAVPDLAPVWAIADAFLLSSRLDPFPNVAIDAMTKGIPSICFKDASGIAELLLTNPATAVGVVEYLDAQAAADVILRLASDADAHARLSAATVALAKTSLTDIESYAAKLDALGSAAELRLQQQARDADTLLDDDAFDEDMFLGQSPVIETRAHTVARYLAIASARGELFKHVRRPSPGFHPFAYRDHNRSRMRKGENALASFVRSGKPEGAWFHTVLRSGDPVPAFQSAKPIRAALHAHFFYPELAGDFLVHLAKNTCRCDLLISTDTAGKAQELRASFARYDRGAVNIRSLPNRGRDIGPLLTGFFNEMAAYDVVGHVHAKRSLIVGDHAVGENWRHFLWQNLLGGNYAMLDRILTEFQNDDRLGLVFPSDPHLISWDDNREVAAGLAARMGWSEPLPDHFDFPLGTMFWMRRQALQPLLDLRLGWDDYPDEPLPYDGTILHAMERLMPTVCQMAGFKSAVTHVPGVWW